MHSAVGKPINQNRSSSLDALGSDPDGFLALDSCFRVRYANSAAARILGLKPPPAAGDHLERVLGKGRASSFLRQMRRAFACPKIFLIEGRERGSQIEVKAHATTDGVDVFLKDATERTHLEIALKEEGERRRLVEERFAAALSVNPMVVLNIDDHLQYTWVYNNQLHEADANFSGRSPAEFFDSETAPSILSFFRSVIDSGRPGRTELSLRPVAIGEMRHYISSAKPMFSEDGKVVGLTGASIDVTEIVRQKRELERARKEALLAKAEAERANLAKSKFLAAASHDLRQPVQSLFLLLAVLEGRMAGREPDHVVEKISAALDALRLLLDSMLDISKLDAGLIVPKFEAVAVGSILSRLAREYRLRAEEQGLTFRFSGTTLWAWSDGSLIERALRNLIENAIRYTPRGKILLGCRRHEGRVRIDVVDTGIGIAAEDRESVFEEFQQIQNSARDRTQGLGLGLAIVRRLARLLGGEVDVDSNLGRGSRFSLTLPSAPAAGVDGPAVQGAIDGAGREILLIEDDAILRESLDLLFRHWSFTTRTAESGEEAVEAVREGFRPALIVGDYRLKGSMNGVETIGLIRETLGHPIPSLIITGDTAPERIREVLNSGLRILHKPIAAEDILREVRQMVGGDGGAPE